VEAMQLRVMSMGVRVQSKVSVVLRTTGLLLSMSSVYLLITSAVRSGIAVLTRVVLLRPRRLRLSSVIGYWRSAFLACLYSTALIIF
jgi:hypothetical protein